jgi:hypothetical protein
MLGTRVADGGCSCVQSARRTDVMDMFNDGGPLISVLSKDVLKLDPVDGVIRSIIPFKLGA